MARQVLENGVILPAEYSDDWYDDMTSNLTKLDDVIGSDSEKLSSSDVGAAALSNSYNDLDNLPTIPTVNDATLTIQKNGVDVQTFTANASSNVTANITVPTKTSDLTNDSNFVDTSNSAVASGITSAKVTSYDTHVADTGIHVTTADKSKWNNGVSQAYVFRYSSTALVASSTNSNTLLDNADNLKVGDKVIDSSGVLFSITAIDTANSTFTIGTALIDLAQDSDVVHKSGNETISGTKTFLDVPIPFKSSTAELGVTGGSTKVIFTDKNLLNLAGITFGNYGSSKLSYCKFHIYDKDSNNQEIENFIEFSYVNNNNLAYFRPNKSNFVTLGSINNRWSKVYADEYYYGSNNVEFSTKFVTTDTAQTITYPKTFTTTPSFTGYPSIRLYSSTDDVNVLPSAHEQREIRFTDKNNVLIAYFVFQHRTDANEPFRTCWRQSRLDGTENYYSVNFNNLGEFYPENNNGIKLGTSTKRWKDCQTYLINGLTPSSLSMPDIDNRVDISSYITDLTGVNNEYTPTVNGWICVRSGNATKISILDSATSIGNQSVSSTATYLTVMTPVVANRKVYINIMCTSLEHAYFIPCQGNV